MSEKYKVLLLGSEYCGRGDDNLGYEVMLDFLKWVADEPGKLKAVILWNEAVRLMAKGSPAVPHLKKMEEQGVEVLGGTLCLENLEIIDNMGAGKPTIMSTIKDLLLNNEVITV